MKLISIPVLLVACMISFACSSKQNSQTPEGRAAAQPEGSFNSDSAYSYVAAQVAFGPRVPGSASHLACADYIVGKLHQFGADTVLIQQGTVEGFDGTRMPLRNILAQFNTAATKRILLAAHYDTRPWADQDPDSENHTRPIPGANDGGSGVGVLLEIARNLQLRAPQVGVDFFFIDCEDSGSHDAIDDSRSWCLGSQYWSHNPVPYTEGHLPVYGILLDMVGAPDAQFPYEYFSQIDGITPTIRVWSEAERLGYSETFPRRVGGAITDDHLYLINAGIPTTDVVECGNPVTGNFPTTWHTMDDNMDNISRQTLDRVGKTVLSTVYRETPGQNTNTANLQ